MVIPETQDPPISIAPLEPPRQGPPPLPASFAGQVKLGHQVAEEAFAKPLGPPPLPPPLPTLEAIEHLNESFGSENLEKPIVEPVLEPIVEPVAEPIVEPIAEHVAEPIAEPVLEPIAEHVAEPIAEHTIEPLPVDDSLANPFAATQQQSALLLAPDFIHEAAAIHPEAATALPPLGLEYSWHGRTPFDDVFVGTQFVDGARGGPAEQIEYFREKLIRAENRNAQVRLAWQTREREMDTLEVFYQRLLHEVKDLRQQQKNYLQESQNWQETHKEQQAELGILREEKEQVTHNHQIQLDTLQQTLGNDVAILQKELAHATEQLDWALNQNQLQNIEQEKLRKALNESITQFEQDRAKYQNKIAGFENTQNNIHREHEQAMSRAQEVRQALEYENMVQQQTFIRLRDTLKSQRETLDIKEQQIVALQQEVNARNENKEQVNQKWEQACTLEREKNRTLMLQLDNTQHTLQMAQLHTEQLQQEFQRDLTLHQENIQSIKKMLEQSRLRCAQLEESLENALSVAQKERNFASTLTEERNDLLLKAQKALEIAADLLS